MEQDRHILTIAERLVAFPDIFGQGFLNSLCVLFPLRATQVDDFQGSPQKQARQSIPQGFIDSLGSPAATENQQALFTFCQPKSFSGS
jgi:hypothetical protein